MGFRLPRVVPVKKFLQRSFSNDSSKSASMVVSVPKGHFAIYVGLNDKKRFIVPVSLLTQSSFRELLVQTEDEYGFDHPMGGLTLACSEDDLLSLVPSLNSS